MNKENAHLFLPYVQALTEGETIQEIIDKKWTDLPDPRFSRGPECYRVKPKPPKPREFEIGIHHELRKDGDTPCCISESGKKLRTCTGEIIRVREIIEEPNQQDA